jgi:hypothetical protein
MIPVAMSYFALKTIQYYVCFLGGTASLYIGISFISIIELAFWIFQGWKGKSRNASTEEETISDRTQLSRELTNYANLCTVHGVKYLTKGYAPLERIFWFFAVSLMLIIGSIQVRLHFFFFLSFILFKSP